MFIDQLGVFTPIEVKMVVEANLYEGSKAINHETLKKRLRDAHLTQEEEIINSSLLQLVDAPREMVQRELIQTVDPMVLKALSGVNQKKVSLNKFE